MRSRTYPFICHINELTILVQTRRFILRHLTDLIFFLNDFLADTGNHLNPIKYEDINLGSWLTVEYENKYYVGIAMEKSDDDRLVQDVWKSPLAARIPRI